MWDLSALPSTCQMPVSAQSLLNQPCGWEIGRGCTGDLMTPVIKDSHIPYSPARYLCLKCAQWCCELIVHLHTGGSPAPLGCANKSPSSARASMRSPTD